jgi:hypothetical protein
MALVPSIRVNPQAPWPTLVTGTGPITIAKQNGVWKVGFSIANLGAQIPPAVNYPTDYILVYDANAQAFFKMPLTGIGAIVAGAGRTQRSITAGGNFPITGADSILNISNAADLTPPIPLAATRNGSPLTFKNKWNSHAQTLTLTNPDVLSFDGPAGAATTVELAPGASITLVPFNDGANAGWAIE